MRYKLLVLMPMAALAAACAGPGVSPLEPAPASALSVSVSMNGGSAGTTAAGGGFDAFGYNRTAGIFNGAADGVDGSIDGKYYGGAAYAADHLKMKWNADWDRGNAEGWDDPNGYSAWIDNQWNGKAPGGSGETWQYRIKWIGSCGADGTPTGTGGYCVWGQFEVVLSHGTSANQHFWDAHAVPAGFGR